MLYIRGSILVSFKNEHLLKNMAERERELKIVGMETPMHFGEVIREGGLKGNPLINFHIQDKAEKEK